MRCARCGKNFDEDLYSGICPKCGHFNNKQKEFDVSKYFSAKFEDGDKVSTSAQGARQHAELHRAYDGYDMHKPGAAGQHEKLHEMYDRVNMHKPQANSYRQAGNAQGKGVEGKGNLYQQMAGQIKNFQATQVSAYRQENANGQGQLGGFSRGNTYKPGQSATYKPGSYRNSEQTAKLNGEIGKKNYVIPICIIIAVLAIILTVVGCRVKENRVIGAYTTVDYEQEYAEAGQVFEINGRLLMVEKAETVEVMMEEMPRSKKLAVVSVEVLPTEEWDRNWTSGMVYVSDGISCHEYMNDYYFNDYLESFTEYDEILDGYNYLGYSSVDGISGVFCFMVDKDAEEITISFDEQQDKNGISVLKKRVSVPLMIEEAG